MKRIYTLLITAFTLLASATSIFAQKEGDRLVVNSTIGKTQGFWLNKVEKINFFYGYLDLETSVDFDWINNIMHVDLGKDVRKIRFAFVSPKNITDQTPDQDLYKFVLGLGDKYYADATPDPKVRRMKYNIPPFKSDENMVLLWGEDEYGCPGPIYRSVETKQSGTILVPTFRSMPKREGQRMVITVKKGAPVQTPDGEKQAVEKIGFWTDQVQNFKYLTEAPDLKTSLTAKPIEGQTGAMKIALTAGVDARRVHLIFLENFMVTDKTTDDDLRKIMENPYANAHWVETPDPNNRTLDINAAGLQHGYSYVAVTYGVDEYGCKGEITRTPFDVPKGKLAGNPEVKVEVTNITATEFTVTATPNTDAKGYFLLMVDKEDPDLERTMKQFIGTADLKRYAIKYGTNFTTKRPHEKAYTITFRNNLPNKTYHVLIVIADKNGQFSDLKEYPVTTQKLGGEGLSKIKVTVTNITPLGATVNCEPNAETGLYRYFVIPVGIEGFYTNGNIDKEKVLKYCKEAPNSPGFPLDAGNKSWTWSSLATDTDHVAIAVGMNANNEWGEMTIVPFRTLKQ